MTDADPPTPSASRLEWKAAALLALFVALLTGATAYLLYARGAFEAKQTLVLVADDSEGVRVGMDLTFSGFPIGRVRRIELAPDGKARIVVDVPRKDAHWLRSSSVFTLVRSLVGGANLRAYSGILSDPPLPDGAERPVLIGDASAELPRLVSDARELLQNLSRQTAPDSALAASLANVQALTERMNGPHGVPGALLGSDEDARRVGSALARADALLARLDRLVARLDAMAASADRQLLGPEGLVRDARATVTQLDGALADVRATLKRVDALLVDAQAVAANARVATTDLGALRREVDATVRKVEQLIDEVNRKWPFARDAEPRLK